MSYNNIIKVAANDLIRYKWRIIFSIPAIILITIFLTLPEIFNPEEPDPGLIEKLSTIYDLKINNVSSIDVSEIRLLNVNIPFLIIFPSFLAPLFFTIDSIIEEKNNRTLESLLVLPLTDREILYGKMAIGIFSGIMSSWGLHIFCFILALIFPGYLLFVSLASIKWILISLSIVPALAFFSNTIGIIIAITFKKIQTAHICAFLILSPFFVFFFLMNLELVIIPLEFLVLSFLVVNTINILLFKISTKLFRREWLLLRY